MLNGRNPSVDSFDSAEEDTPESALDSTSALVLVLDHDDSDTPFHFSSDDEEDGELDLSEIDWLSSSTTSLSSTVVFIYLLSPFLTLGALFIPDGSIPLKYGIPALCVFAILSAFSRYIWYMLARYVRKTTTEDIVVNAFARTHRHEGRRTVIKNLVKLGDGLLRTSLSTTFLTSEEHASDSRYAKVDPHHNSRYRCAMPNITPKVVDVAIQSGLDGDHCSNGFATVSPSIIRVKTCHNPYCHVVVDLHRLAYNHGLLPRDW